MSDLLERLERASGEYYLFDKHLGREAIDRIRELEGVVDYLVANGTKIWAPQNIQREIDASIRRCSPASGGTERG